MNNKQDVYRQPYLLLFRGVTEALEQLQQQNYGVAAALLKKAQQAAEEAYISQDEEFAKEKQPCFHGCFFTVWLFAYSTTMMVTVKLSEV